MIKRQAEDSQQSPQRQRRHRSRGADCRQGRGRGSKNALHQFACCRDRVYSARHGRQRHAKQVVDGFYLDNLMAMELEMSFQQKISFDISLTRMGKGATEGERPSLAFASAS
jgi:hypothetical protein